MSTSCPSQAYRGAVGDLRRLITEPVLSVHLEGSLVQICILRKSATGPNLGAAHDVGTTNSGCPPFLLRHEQTI